MDITFLDVFRLVNAVLASIVFAALVYKGRMYYRKYSLQQKYLFLAFLMYVFTAAYGSVESYSQNVPFGYRIIGLFIANVLAAVGLFVFNKSALVEAEKDTAI